MDRMFFKVSGAVLVGDSVDSREFLVSYGYLENDSGEFLRLQTVYDLDGVPVLELRIKSDEDARILQQLNRWKPSDGARCDPRRERVVLEWREVPDGNGLPERLILEDVAGHEYGYINVFRQADEEGETVLFNWFDYEQYGGDAGTTRTISDAIYLLEGRMRRHLGKSGVTCEIVPSRWA